MIDAEDGRDITHEIPRPVRSEQFAHIVLGVADLAAVMVQGRITAVGRPSDIEAELSSAYLGANL